MARNSTQDPATKFRFQVTILDNMAKLLTNGTSSVAMGAQEPSGDVIKGGFSECITPKSSTKEIIYRENNGASSPIKIPGLTTYEPVVLKRGSSNNRQLYNWYKIVNNNAAMINKFMGGITELGVPFQDPNFRKEVFISSVARDGSYIKHWLLYNAWPSGYKGISDFDSKVSESAVEELTLSYELCLEVTGEDIQSALNKLKVEAEQAAVTAAAALAIGASLGALSKLF